MHHAETIETVLHIEGAAYVPASEVCKRLRVARQTLWRWRQAGHIPAGRRFRDRQIVFTPAEVELIIRYANKLEPAIVARSAAENTKGQTEP